MGKRYSVLASVLAIGMFAALMLPAQGKKPGALTVYMSALEYKGGANVADEAYPPAEEPGTLALEPLGGGYGIKEPDSTGRWEVNSYRFEPGFITVEKGTKVTLEIVGINGKIHSAELTDPSGNSIETLTITRGRMTIVEFRPKKTGLWTLTCHTHQPGMTATILVTE